MKVLINNKETETNATNVAQLMAELGMPDRGVAVAIGNQMVQRTAWEETALKENDSIIVIKAACGG